MIGKNLLMITSREGIKIDELTIKADLEKCGIYILDENFKHKKDIQKSDIISQVNLIIEAHKILAGYKFNGLIRIKSIIGKEIEEYKMQLKRLQKYYDHLIGCDCKSSMEKIILCEGKSLLKQGWDSLNYLNNRGYISIIERSMNREEICIGRCDETNLRRKNGHIEVGTIKGLSYNLIEEDIYKYIKKMQRRKIDFSVERIIKEFTYNSHLSANSLLYLKGLCSYPRDTLRVWQKYIDKKCNKTEEEFIKQFFCSMKYEEQKIYY